MTPDELARIALGLPETAMDHAFGPEVNVYKVAGKVFGILQPGGDPPRVTLKCEPALALELRAQFPAVVAGYHTDKRHWNTVTLDGSVPDDEISDMVEHSYERVVATLPKAVRLRLDR
ncbi:MAG TPA: MmcQ/YjbR family DNA-binding protein [Actinophytocola sp.]|jgi:predicted DNA-binding protein (MmcQ/YjbR family)|nr:MmcQ/YjbR family DNA-binding protein [Actinophytocola sp.]